MLNHKLTALLALVLTAPLAAMDPSTTQTTKISHTGFGVACFLIGQKSPEVYPVKEKEINPKIKIISDFWTKSFPLEKKFIELHPYREKINNFKTLHEQYKNLESQLDPRWNRLQNTLKKQSFDDLLLAINLGDFLVYSDNFLNASAQQLYKKIGQKPELFEQSKEKIGESTFKVNQTSWDKIGTYTYPSIVTIEKGYHQHYDHRTVDFFSKDGFITLPEDGWYSVSQIKIQEGTLETTGTIRKGDTSMLKKQKPIPFFCIAPINGSKTASVGAYTFSISSWRDVTVTIHKKVVASAHCLNPSKQISINSDCFVCAPTLSCSPDKKSSNQLIIVDFKTGTRHLFPYAYPETSAFVKIRPDISPEMVYYNNRHVFVQWDKEIESFDLDSGLHTVYETENRIQALQVSPDGHYLVVCTWQPGSGLKMIGGAGSAYTYHVFRLTKKLVSLKKQLRTTIPPKPTESGIITTMVNSTLSYVGLSKTEPKKLVTTDSIFTAASKK